MHAYLCDSRVPLLAVRGRNDEIFLPAGALAFADDAPGAEICLLDGRPLPPGKPARRRLQSLATVRALGRLVAVPDADHNEPALLNGAELIGAIGDLADRVS